MKLCHILICLPIAACALAADLTPVEGLQQIAALRSEIARHNELYHRQDAPVIGDAEYDRMKQRLVLLEQMFPDAARALPPPANLGDDRSGLFQTYRHRKPMLSLEKAYAPASLRAFHARLVKTIGREDLEYIVEPKYDGLAVSVTYEKGRLVRAVTRGNGVEGDDITANVLQIAGLPRELRGGSGVATPEWIELRGEIYVPGAEFDRVNVERDLAGEPRFANPRNLAAGTVRQLDGREVARRGVRVVFFSVGGCEPDTFQPRSQRALHAALETWGLPAISPVWTARGIGELARAVDDFELARVGFPFPTDGAVIKLDNFSERQTAGESEAAPRWAIAYKFAPERVETQLRAISLQVGRTGLLTPVAELVPVQLAGSKVARATLHNREEIARKDIREGDFVYLEKAGDVIPAVVGVNLQRRPAEAAPYRFPIACPACHSLLARSEMEVAVRCPNQTCPAQIRRRIEHFASKACVDIEGLGPSMIESLVGHGWVKDLPDLYRLHRDDLLTLGKHNEKSIDRLLAAIEQSKRAELWRVIHGMGLPQVGASTAKDLARQCGSLTGLAEHGGKAATVLAEPRYQNMIADLISVGFDRPAATEHAVSAGATLLGKSFVLTGTLPGLTRAAAIEKIEAAGGKVTSTVSRATEYIVAGEKPGAKLAEARELGIVVLDEAALLRMIEGK